MEGPVSGGVGGPPGEKPGAGDEDGGESKDNDGLPTSRGDAGGNRASGETSNERHDA